MIKVSFYLIEKTQSRQVDVACRLCQQIYAKHRIWVYGKDESQCQSFDALLWGYDATQFIPHGVAQFEAPICVSHELPRLGFDVCINLSGKAINITNLPHSDIHIIEIVGHNEQDKKLLREIFKQYREWDLDPIIHKI